MFVCVVGTKLEEEKKKKKIQIPLAGSHCSRYQDLNEYLTELCGMLYKLTKKNAKSNELGTREGGYLALLEEHAGAGARLAVVAGLVVRHHDPLLRLFNSSIAGRSHR